MLCPLCNGIVDTIQLCDICGGVLTECGRLTDWTGPYEPYGPLSAGPETGRPYDASGATCIHIVYCESCGHLGEVMVAGWPVG
ncbi:hypothetical protein [Paenibacillus sp. PAMC21692]|uniref:hypothetical protein n=1 Tax=Paenibacillus sp. PAMC21692 TaxID=2762320 RepID=UPI00164D587C|nr:hypothetical protein [Paenibacillus sp. PAMC21692]QNK56165.1 hypothetical protein H7F31_26920 [Paenibacillus sp. PAMC21692]